MPKFDRRSLLQMIGLGVAGSAMPPALVRAHQDMRQQRKPATGRAPNILFIMTDDQARGALSVYGNEVLRTPNMDRIGNEGLRFDEAFVTTSVCAPSRASYLTGLYAHTHGVTSNGEEQVGTSKTACATTRSPTRCFSKRRGTIQPWSENGTSSRCQPASITQRSCGGKAAISTLRSSSTARRYVFAATLTT